MALFTLVSLLQNLASQHPDRIAYTFLEDGEKPSASLTYRSLDAKARAIATYLQSQLSVGERVLLVYPQGLEAIGAFFGCLYAGVVAIPAPALFSGVAKTYFTEIGGDRLQCQSFINLNHRQPASQPRWQPFSI